MKGEKLQAQHTYDWDTFEEKVLGEKFAVIDKIFSGSADYGNSYLYNIIDLLRQAESDSINIARLAYLLARREPSKGAAHEFKQSYRNFVQNVYRWALNHEDRQQLITAIIIYIYYNRMNKEVNQHE